MCNDPGRLQSEYGQEQARKILRCHDAMLAADSLAVLRTLPHLQAHELAGKRRGQIALTIKQPYRLIIVPDYDEPPRLPDGGLDWQQVNKVKIVEVVDYHD